MSIYNLVRKPPEPYAPPTWGGGTDAEIIEAVQKHYNNEIDLTQYWSVGDEREITLSAMSATGVGESHVSQTATLVLVNQGGKTLETAVNGHTECAFVWHFKNCMLEKGYMNSSASQAKGWAYSRRRTWCNNTFFNALPSHIQTITKSVLNQSAYGDESRQLIDSYDYIALPAMMELGFPTGFNQPYLYTEGTAWQYYSSDTNALRIKYLGDSSSSSEAYWSRSAQYETTSYWCLVAYNGALNYSSYQSNANLGIAPFGCI